MQIPLRILTAAAIFDGHDASINLIRRLLQERGAEIIHLGHNRSVNEVVDTAIQEDVNAIAISSYQGGHLEYFEYLLKQLKQHHAENILVFGGGGGTISKAEAVSLQKAGVSRIYTADDGHRMGLDGMADEIIQICRKHFSQQIPKIKLPSDYSRLSYYSLAQYISAIEREDFKVNKLNNYSGRVIGITGTGGSGKSTLIDELLHNALTSSQSFQPPYRIAYLAMDPSRPKTGGALLGDRIRINAAPHKRLFIRSLATRQANQSISPALPDIIKLLQQVGFQLIVVETAGIGQSDISVTEYVDHSIYVMTEEFGAPSQLEKIAMLDEADCIVLNKYEQRGGPDALREIKKQWRRNHKQFAPEFSEPIFPMTAGNFNNTGLVKFIAYFLEKINLPIHSRLPFDYQFTDMQIPLQRQNYLGEIAQLGRQENQHIEQQVQTCRLLQSHYESLKALNDPALPTALESYSSEQLEQQNSFSELRHLYSRQLQILDHQIRENLQNYFKLTDEYSDNSVRSRSHTPIRKITLPKHDSWDYLCRFIMQENLPGQYPYTAGVFPFRREAEEPTRMFAGEGIPEDTNRRFFYLLKDQKSTRLSTAFDPISLYGKDPCSQQDVYGCIGMSGVSVACLDDMKKLYSGIDLNAPETSVSMTINGPAPIFMAWFIHTAIDQRIESYLKNNNRWYEVERIKQHWFKDKKIPHYQDSLPQNHSGLGLGLLGISGQLLVSEQEYQQLAAETMQIIRGTLQADILKEEMAQNECLFSLPFGLHLMADLQKYFIDHQIKHFYPVSVSGYHIAEAGANPVTQLAFTLANGFTLAEYYLAHGMNIDDFAAKFSFFFSNGMDPEYAVIGRAARRIWARAMKKYYAANSNSQKLKYHIQTSGRSLHAQEIELNDIRTTLQAQYALNDNCNSLHTNAYDEAVTTPTEESVRRALAIQMIIQRELGLNLNQNPMQGSFTIDYLTEQLELAIYDEFDRLSQRGGVLGAIESFYQRGKIQDESYYYEQLKNTGALPIIGVNTFLNNEYGSAKKAYGIIHCSNERKQLQLQSIEKFKQNHKKTFQKSLDKLQSAVLQNRNSFSALMEACVDCTLEQLTQALFEIGGAYRRKM